MKIKKKDVRLYNTEELIINFKDIQELIAKEYPNMKVNFSFDKGFYKKYDTKNIKKIKDYIQTLNNFLATIQELRSRNLSLMEITDIEILEHGIGILTNSFKG